MYREDITFRYAIREDVKLIYTFVKKLAEYEGMPQAVLATEADLEEWLFDKEKAEVIFAVVDGKEIGFSLFYEIYAAYVGKGGLYIDDLYVEPEYRGKGYGKALLKQMAKEVLLREGRRLEWACLKSNTKSYDFYVGMGAVPAAGCEVFRVTGDALFAMCEK